MYFIITISLSAKAAATTEPSASPSTDARPPTYYVASLPIAGALPGFDDFTDAQPVQPETAGQGAVPEHGFAEGPAPFDHAEQHRADQAHGADRVLSPQLTPHEHEHDDEAHDDDTRHPVGDDHREIGARRRGRPGECGAAERIDREPAETELEDLEDGVDDDARHHRQGAGTLCPLAA